MGVQGPSLFHSLEIRRYHFSLSLSHTHTRARAQSCRSHISPPTTLVTLAQMWFKKREEVAQAKAELKVYKEKTNTRQQQAVCVAQQP